MRRDPCNAPARRFRRGFSHAVKAESAGQPFAVGPAQQKLAAINEDDIAVAVAASDEESHTIDPDNRRTVNAREFCGIEPLLDVNELPAPEMNGLANVNAEIVAGDVDVIDMTGIDNLCALLLLDRQAPKILAWPVSDDLAQAELLARAIERSGEAIAAERFGQVIAGADVERLQCLLAVGGQKDRDRPRSRR